MAKKLIVPQNNAERLLAVLSENQDQDIYIASKLAANWRYINFWNPITGTPCLALEYLFGSRGVLGGRLMKLEAPFGVGKSSFMFYIYGCAQHDCDAWCWHGETEAAPPPADFIAGFGVDTTNLLIEQPKSLERCIARMDELICRIRGGFGGSVGESGRQQKSKFTDALDADRLKQIVMGIDSVSGLGLDDAVELDVIDPSKTTAISKHARILREYFRNRTLRWKQTDTLVMMAAQQTAKIQTGNMPIAQDKKITTLAGEAIGYHSTYILDMRATKLVDAAGVNVGEKVVIKTLKNKVADKGREITMFLVRNKGFDITATDIEFFVSHPASPFPKDAVKRYNGGIICKQLSDKRFETENDFLRALYGDAEVMNTIREAMRIRGFGFDFESRFKLPDPDAPEPELQGTPVPGDSNVVEGSTSNILGA